MKIILIIQSSNISYLTFSPLACIYYSTIKNNILRTGMNNVLEYRETSHGSFKAWGTGFRYDYNSGKRSLNVIHHDSERLLARLNFDSLLSKSPRPYVKLIEKTSQINALMFSNNQTINLAGTMNEKHLTAIIQNVSVLSRHAFDLQSFALKRFCQSFAHEHNLKSVKIKQFMPRDLDSGFFIARLQTHHDNNISVRACTLAGLMTSLSDRTLNDLMTMEFGHRFEGSAHNLLNASSKLSSLSYILDEDFMPKSKVLQQDVKKNDFINSDSSY